MKRLKMGLLIIVLLMLATVVPVSAVQQITVKIDGAVLNFPDARPFLEGGRTLVPIRAIAEALGSEVAWNPDTRIVGFQKGSDIILLQIGSRSVTINDRRHTIDVPAKISQGRTYVPLRFISEALGANVEWVASTRTVLITTDGEVAVTPPPVHVEVLSQAELDRLYTQIVAPAKSVVRHDIGEIPLEESKRVADHIRKNAKYTAIISDSGIMVVQNGQYVAIGIAQKTENGSIKQADATFIVNKDFRNNNALTNVIVKLVSDWR